MKKGIRIAILRHGFYPDDPRVFKEARALVGAGYAVEIFCLRGPGQPARENLEGVRVFRAPLTHRRGSRARYVLEYGVSMLWMALRLAARFVRRRYDLVQVNTLPDALVFATLIPRLFGARILLDLHEPTPELYATKYPGRGSSFMFRLHVRIERAAIRYAHRVLTVNETIRRRFIERGAPAEKLVVVRNVPDEDLFGQPVGRPKPPPGFLLVTHGTLQPRYGHELLLRALALVRESAPGARLEVIGDGETAEELKRLARELRVDDRVVFVGAVPMLELPGRLIRADAGVVPLLPSPFADLCQPNKLFEYVALGIPVIAARLPAIEETFDDACLRYFTPGDPESLARAIEELYSYDERRRAFAGAALRRYDAVRWREMHKVYLDAVKETLNA